MIQLMYRHDTNHSHYIPLAAKNISRPRFAPPSTIDNMPLIAAIKMTVNSLMNSVLYRIRSLIFSSSVSGKPGSFTSRN